MIQLDVREPHLDGQTLLAPNTWWLNVFHSFSILAGVPFQTQLEQLAQEWGGAWVFGFSVDGVRNFWPDAIVFEREEDATLFLLRWA